MKSSWLSLLPFGVFLLIFLGSGIYFEAIGTEFAFYQISPTVAIIPAIVLSVLLSKQRIEKEIEIFIAGVSHSNIIIMCLIFMLAGAFSSVTTAIGSVASTVNFAISLVPSQALLPSIFLISAFISTAIGTSMGVVAALVPVAVGIANTSSLALPLAVGAVISGAMFGDNISIISDTTIASVQSMGADLKKKLKLNIPIALISAIIVVIILFLLGTKSDIVIAEEYLFIKISPYILIFILSFFRIHVFKTLIIGIMFAGLIGIVSPGYTIVNLSQDIYKGFLSMNEILILSMFIGGLSNMIASQGGLEKITFLFKKLFFNKRKSAKRAELTISSLISVIDVLIANNTIAIILSSKIAKELAEENNVSPERAANCLHIFSCVFQGILPYGAQILLASSLSNVKPLDLMTTVHYCYVLVVVALLFILLRRSKNTKII
jgi:Na+/H+ antiporter NhaC